MRRKTFAIVFTFLIRFKFVVVINLKIFSSILINIYYRKYMILFYSIDFYYIYIMKID